MDVLYEIKQKYSTFSLKEKIIADYILSFKNSINNISITELAKAIGTSSSTLTRFSKKINCESFVDMKMKLNSKNKNLDSKKENDSLFSAVYNYYSEVIEKSNELLDKKLISKIVKDIKEAKKIYIYGVGSSGLTAQEFMQRLLRMGFNISSINDSHMMIINSAIVSSEDLVIGISISGETKEVVNALRICYQNRARTIAVTSFPKSSISRYANEIISICSSDFINKTNFINTQFSTMYLFDLISTILLEDVTLNRKMQLTIDAILK
ncbi:MurR/RpiR family transcriptional regulator [uncultured Cetobacterium sp.]|uniref:MurR/RpiR family transcriptional regulator n=1 Tax=uncultured Cetobacterium sp. TaxID=527638 RepID=UPI002632F4EF|nr:MurR/RpiR family transcriptional regulator [uncultured Cetobacterium sp.]